MKFDHAALLRLADCRREGAGMKSKWGQTGESLELVRGREFMGPPGSGAAQSQPFEVTIDGQVRISTGNGLDQLPVP